MNKSILVCQNCRTPLTGRQTKNCARCKPHVKRAYYREYNRRNAEKKRRVASEWQENNREYATVYQREYYQENKDIKRARRKVSSRLKRPLKRKYHREWRKKNRDKLNASSKRYRQNNPDKMRLGRQHRRAAELQAEHTLTLEEWNETLEGTDGKCVYCGATWEHQDHFVPLSKGGGYTALNMVPACGKCNRAKGTMMPFDYIVCFASR